MSELVALIIVGAAQTAGLIANRWVRPFADTEVKGVKLEALVGPIMSLTVLLVAFTLVNVFASYNRGVQSVSDEARKVDFLYELGGYASDGPAQVELRSATACYAAAVAGPEWEVMVDGRDVTDRVAVDTSDPRVDRAAGAGRGTHSGPVRDPRC